MSILSDFTIDSFVEDNYDRRLERLVSDLKDLPQDQRLILAPKIAFWGQANSFAKTLIFLLLNRESGVFKNDIGNLNELTLDKLYEAIVIWYSWIRIPVNSAGEKDQAYLNFCIDSTETCLGISRHVAKVYYDGLAGETNLLYFALYRWCMLAVGHIDSSYESMHENSPDYKQFTTILYSALIEVGKHWDKE